MGKIYDALEKSKQYNTIKLSEPKRMHASLKDVDSEAAVTPFPMSFVSTHKRLDSSLISYFKPQSTEAEQFRKLAANIVFHHAEKTGSCLLITSASAGEGKSFLTANLAISLAKSLEEPILLLDCDLRRPRLHKMFGFGNVPGLSDHFIKDMDISALIQKTAIDNLSLLPAGNKSFHSVELLSSKRMTQFLKTLKNIHKDRIILIDSPPPLSTAEPVAIARQMDGVILVVKCEDTPRGVVADLIKNVGREKVLGVVLNRFRKRFKAYHRYGTYQ